MSLPEPSTLTPGKTPISTGLGTQVPAGGQGRGETEARPIRY
jgi:hypothetical protein